MEVERPRQHRRQHAQPVHQPDRAPWVGRQEDALQLAPHPLRRQAGQARHALPQRRERRGNRLAMAVAGVEPEEAQDAQVVLGDPRRRVAHEADPARAQIRGAVEIIIHRAVRQHGHGVHREVPPRRVLLPIRGPGDLRVPPVRGLVAAQRRDLEPPAAAHCGDGAVVQSGRHGAQPGVLQGAGHGVWREGRREVDIGHGPSGDGIPHAAADQPHAGQGGQHRQQRRVGQERRRRDAQRRLRCHPACPGTMRPLRSCAGM